MKKLKLYNSLSNTLEDFIPINAGNVRMYSCGPTVYASPHIGNARPLVVFDILYRVLRRLYANCVTYVRNITDVDDKINARAKLENISIGELTTAVTAEFHKNLKLINVLPVTHEPRATDHISEMLSLIDMLRANGFAYEAEGHVLFRVKKMAQYGMLSKRSVDDMIAGSRVEVAAYKEDPMDFVLWKPSQDGDPAWDSKYGLGRPGWHIECSAMSHKYLGEQFDIHTGGQDLMFPHHENELAQNFGAFGCIMANYWIHNGMLLVDNQKMSKSLGNIISLDHILQKYDGEVIRYVLLSTHYQKTLNWTDQSVNHALQALDRLYGALDNTNAANTSGHESSPQINSPVLDALCANLNTPLALKYLHGLADMIYKSCDADEINRLGHLLRQEAEILGLLQKNSSNWFRNSSAELDENEIQKLIAEREKAKMEKNFLLADEIRAKLLKSNIKIEDTRDGTIWKFLRNH
ncbi:MAG: cysteine--tRNA ligase [Holosporaceae bacterium]|jgi:cysteinyl-tRNA synthetase|nr:cysteine--tRNA ligase [Holosporaceae bacterium]